ncbi:MULTISPECIES: hypothetical protein [Vibrio]|nr:MULTISPECIES: hypothetical protein [Vibrio]
MIFRIKVTLIQSLDTMVGSCAFVRQGGSARLIHAAIKTEGQCHQF